MSIESSNAASQNTKATAGVHALNGKKTGKAEVGAGQAAGGFSALMGLLSASDPQGTEAQDTLPTTPDPVQGFIDQNTPLVLSDKAQEAINMVANLLSSASSAAGSVATGSVAAGSVAAGSVAAGSVPLQQVSVAESPASTLLAQAGSQPQTAGVPLVSSESASAIVNAVGGGADGLTTDVQPRVVADSPAVSQTRTAVSAPSFDKPGVDKTVLSNTAGLTVELGSGAVQTTADQALQAEVNRLLGHRSVVQSQTASAVQASLRDAKSTSPMASATDVSDMSTVFSMSAVGEMLVRPQERSAPKNQAGSGFEGAFASAQSEQVRADAVFEVPPAAAIVPEASIAETVSYWASHGVQSAELTLDGFGSEPVQVSISLNGDQAQIDFRTNQDDVRQVLEGAMGQLKELLSSEGLQLAGTSVGFSTGGGSQGDGRQPKQDTKQANFVAKPAAVSSAGRNANPSVGRTLDLFV